MYSPPGSLSCLKSGIKIALSREIRPFIIIPILISIVLFSTLGYTVINGLSTWMSAMDTLWTLPAWLSGLQAIYDLFISTLKVLFWLSTLVLLLCITAYFFTTVTHLIASPFNGLLAEKVEQQLRATEPPQTTWAQLLRRALLREYHKARYFLPRAAGLGLMSWVLAFIPPLNLISTSLWALFAAWMMCLQYTDYAADNNGYSLRDTLDRMRRERLNSISLGGYITIMSIIPVFNWLVMPIAICGATQFWVQHLDKPQH